MWKFHVFQEICLTVSQQKCCPHNSRVSKLTTLTTGQLINKSHISLLLTFFHSHPNPTPELFFLLIKKLFVRFSISLWVFFGFPPYLASYTEFLSLTLWAFYTGILVIFYFLPDCSTSLLMQRSPLKCLNKFRLNSLQLKGLKLSTFNYWTDIKTNKLYFVKQQIYIYFLVLYLLWIKISSISKYKSW